MKKAADIINALMDSILKTPSQKEAVSLFSSWSKIAGPNEGSHSWIEEIEDGIVTVKVDHPGWMQKLEMKKGGILSTLRKQYPELGIKTVRFRV